MTRRAVIALALTLAACMPDAPPDKAPPPPPEPTTDACGASELQSLVGGPASVLETMKFGKQVRIIRPGMAVTMDYREDRLNIEIDKRETITRIACG